MGASASLFGAAPSGLDRDRGNLSETEMESSCITRPGPDMHSAIRSEGEEDPDVPLGLPHHRMSASQNRAAAAAAAAASAGQLGKTPNHLTLSNTSTLSTGSTASCSQQHSQPGMARLVMTSTAVKGEDRRRASGASSASSSRHYDTPYQAEISQADLGKIATGPGTGPRGSKGNDGNGNFPPPPLPPHGNSASKGVDPNRLTVLAQTSAQSSVDSGQDTTEGSVSNYSTGTGKESTAAEEEIEEDSFPPLPALPPEAALEGDNHHHAETMMGMKPRNKNIIEHNF